MSLLKYLNFIKFWSFGEKIRTFFNRQKRDDWFIYFFTKNQKKDVLFFFKCVYALLKISKPISLKSEKYFSYAGFKKNITRKVSKATNVGSDRWEKLFLNFFKTYTIIWTYRQQKKKVIWQSWKELPFDAPWCSTISTLRLHLDLYLDNNTT